MTSRVIVAMAAALLGPHAVSAGRAMDIPDIEYAQVDGKSLRLDLHLPANTGEAPPLLVWVHGGAWYAGSKQDYPAAFVRHGFAVASVEFRQSTEARFPANVHDIKAAIRFLRARAGEYGVRADRIAIAGASSGGHLAALVGVTSGHAELEGAVGEHLDQSSSVQAIISYYGASDLTTILDQSTPFGLNVRRPALERLLGALPDSVPQLARLASPVMHVDREDPPLLLFHGDRDPQMPINQAHELEGAYQQHGLAVQLRVLHGVAHGGSAFYEGESLDQALRFLREQLR